MINRIKSTRDINAELSHLEESFSEDFRRLKKRIEKKQSFNLDAYKRTGLELATFRLISQGNEAKLSECLIWYTQLGIKHLQREFFTGLFLKITLGDEEFEIESTNKRSGTSLFDWWKLFNVASILRHDAFKIELYDLLDNCMKESKDPFWRRSMDLILMCNDKKEFEASILSDLKEIVNSGFVEYHGLEGNGLVKSIEGKEIREKLWLPIMELYYLAYQNDEHAFNKLLEEFLLYKKKWIVENKEEDNSGYWIDFPLLACCAYAYDRNIAINIESDYIPSIVYKGEINA